jgi:hypothetical protein
VPAPEPLATYSITYCATPRSTVGLPFTSMNDAPARSSWKPLSGGVPPADTMIVAVTAAVWPSDWVAVARNVCCPATAVQLVVYGPTVSWAMLTLST